MATNHEKTASAVRNLEAKKAKTSKIEKRIQEMELQLKKAREEEAVAAAREILRRMKEAHLSTEELFELIEKNAKRDEATLVEEHE